MHLISWNIDFEVIFLNLRIPSLKLLNMKKLLSIFFSFLFITTVAKTQDVKDLFNETDVPIVWLGIDFSQVKLIGDFFQIGEAGEMSPAQIRNRFFPAWNELVLRESRKYDIAGMFRKDEVIYGIDPIMEINKNASLAEMETESEPNYSKEDIQNFISDYNFDHNEGIGLLFVAESLNKYRERGTYHFVAINLANNEILLHERMAGSAGGFGLRNYWARTYYEVIREITGNYRSWRRAYGR